MSEQIIESQTSEIKLDSPNLYGPWIVDVLWQGDAAGNVPEMKDALHGLSQFLKRDVLVDIGMDADVHAIVTTLQQKIVERTQETAAELNLAMQRYTTELPETYIQVADEWRLVQGFTVGTDQMTLLPVLEGQPYEGAVQGVRQTGSGG